jgi:hypothetical protein
MNIDWCLHYQHKNKEDLAPNHFIFVAGQKKKGLVPQNDLYLW